MSDIDIVVVERLLRGERTEATMDERKAAIRCLLSDLQEHRLSYPQIAARVGVHKATVYRQARRLKFPEKQAELDREVRERRSEIARRYAAGQSQRFIALQLGISRAAVRQHMVASAIQPRPRVSRAGREHWTGAPGSSYYRA